MTDPTAAAREKAREIVWHTTINAPVGSPKWYGEFWEVLAKELAAAEQRGRDAAVPAPNIAGPFIDIVFDGPPSHESGRFIEAENHEGKSISVGQWVKRVDGYWALRISAAPQPKESDDGK